MKLNFAVVICSLVVPLAVIAIPMANNTHQNRMTRPGAVPMNDNIYQGSAENMIRQDLQNLSTQERREFLSRMENWDNLSQSDRDTFQRQSPVFRGMTETQRRQWLANWQRLTSSEKESLRDDENWRFENRGSGDKSGKSVLPRESDETSPNTTINQ